MLNTLEFSQMCSASLPIYDVTICVKIMAQDGPKKLLHA